MKLSNNFLHNRVWRQWLLAPIVIITIALGWKYYRIAFIVPIVMIINMLSPMLKKGRFVCGNICPRGAFFDRMLAPFSHKKKIPAFLANIKFRWLIFILIFGNFMLQVLQPPFTAQHFGHMFWLMCTATTMLALALGLYFSHRIWCAFCPVGTFISTVSKDASSLIVDRKSCVSCRLCEKTCPLNIQIISNDETHQPNQKDCIRCGKCVSLCPRKSLHLQ